jgi:hypothetical protein
MSTKSPALKFRALLTEGDARVLFHRGEVGRPSGKSKNR